MTQTHLALNNRLRWYLSTVVIMSIVLPAIFLSAIEIYSRFKTETTVRSHEQAMALLNVLQKGLTPPLWSFIPENAQDLINGVALNNAVLKIQVLDNQNSPFVEYKKTNYESIARSENYISKTGDVIRNGKLIGSITLQYSLVPARDAAFADSIRIFIIIATQIVVSLTVILFTIKRRVTEPLGYIQKAAQEIAQHNFDIEIPAMHNDEFADVALELNKMKNALSNSILQLEDRVDQRTGDLIQLNTELTMMVERLEGAKDNLVETEKLAALGALVAGVSHELNTPIGNGRVMASSLHESAKRLESDFKEGSMTRSQFENSLEEIVEGTNLIERNLLKAINLVQSFKQIAVDRTSDKRRTFMINEFLIEIQSTMQHIFKATPHTLEVDLTNDVELNSYPGVLSQVISNLINNALMHGLESSEGGRVTIKVVPHVTSLDIQISDNGVGMESGIKKRIFEPFFTTKLGKGGSGLGLHIVHNLTTATLGGRLQVQSSPNNGTVISLAIPIQAPDQTID